MLARPCQLHLCYVCMLLYSIIIHMWQSRVEIKHYPIAYFRHIAELEVLQYRASIRGGAHMHCVNVSSIHKFTLHSMYESHL